MAIILWVIGLACWFVGMLVGLFDAKLAMSAVDWWIAGGVAGILAMGPALSIPTRGSHSA